MADPVSLLLKSLTVSEQLDELQFILENLPHTLPCPQFSHTYPFDGFQLNDEDVEDYGPCGSINRALELTFGFEARTTGDGILPITERGPGVCALVDVLRLYQAHSGAPDSDGILLKWIRDICNGAAKAYFLAAETVST